MATGIGRGRIWLASFNSPTTKTTCWMQRISLISRIHSEL